MHKKSTFSVGKGLQQAESLQRESAETWPQTASHSKKEAEGCMIIIQSISDFQGLKNEEEQSTTSLLYDRVCLGEMQTLLQMY